MTPAASEARRRLAAVDDWPDDDTNQRARGSVWLLRLALEHALDDLWAVHAPPMAKASMRAQLLVLPKYLGAEPAWRVGTLWRALSRVAHHHAYELTPTRSEITTWRYDCEKAISILEERSR